MGIDSSLMWGNMVSFKANEPSRYVQETLAMRDMEKASKIDQNKIVAGLAKKAPDARRLAAIRSAREEAVTYGRNGTLGPTATEMSIALVKADDEAVKAASGAGTAGVLDTTV